MLAPVVLGAPRPGRTVKLSEVGPLVADLLASDPSVHSGRKHLSTVGMGLDGRCFVPDNLHNFYVVPQRKLLICATEKVGMQLFADLTCSLAKPPSCKTS